MSFELKTTEEGQHIEETITKTLEPVITRKLWSKEQLQDEVIRLVAQTEETQERITLLEEQLARFKK